MGRASTQGENRSEQVSPQAGTIWTGLRISGVDEMACEHTVSKSLAHDRGEESLDISLKIYSTAITS